MSRSRALLLMLSCLLSSSGLGCAGGPRFAPRSPVRAEATAGTGPVRAEIRELALGEETTGVRIRVAIAAGPLASLVDARLVGKQAAPCSGGVGVAEMTVDGQERYLRGPADVSGRAHELELQFPDGPVGGWEQDRVALDLELEAPNTVCLRLSMTGTEGEDWQ